MKNVAIIAILIIVVFLAGCASQELGSAEEKTTTTKTTTAGKTTTTTKTTTSTSSGSEESTDKVITDEGAHESDIERQVSTSGTTLTKLRTNIREKGATEKCELPYPLECVKYLANDGIVYITIKNKGYTSKIDNVVLTLNGNECDPVSTYIETGQVKEFECFEDADADYASGPLVMTYHSNIEQRDFTKTGSLNVLME
ncbi:hypothetical protein HZB90_03815 [archaeon]|nr:hypothetical protein [archaeon]